MSEDLKTLGDMRCRIVDGDIFICTCPNAHGDIVKYDELRAEAIKWVKHIDETFKNIIAQPERDCKLCGQGVKDCIDRYEFNGKREWIMHFFNIKESELK